MMRRRPVVGLALGSGAARGFAHLGVLQVLTSAGISVDVISGTSIGSFIGALYAYYGNADDVTHDSVKFIRGPEFRRTRLHALRARKRGQDRTWMDGVTSILKRGYTYSTGMLRTSILEAYEIEECINILIPDVKIEELKIPFAAVATDLTKGAEVVFRSGSLRDAVLASSAIPGVFPPVDIRGDQLVDGGTVNPIPVSVARELGAEFVIAIDISTDLEPVLDLRRSYSIYLRTLDIARKQLQQMQLRDADIVLRPDVSEIHWADFGKFRRGIAAGRAAAQAALPDIEDALHQRSGIFQIFRRSA